MSCTHSLQNSWLPRAAFCWLLLAGWGIGQQVPPPEDGIRDEARALSADMQRQIAGALRDFREDLKFEAWVTATSFLPPGITARRHAQATRQSWDGGRPSVLMTYDRASNSAGLSFSPQLWERYPSTELLELMQEVRRIFADTALSLDERFALAVRSWTAQMRVLESARLKQSLLLQPEEKPFALGFAIALACALVVAALLGVISRLRAAGVEERCLFPEAQVGMRFGAPFGGGVVAEIGAESARQ